MKLLIFVLNDPNRLNDVLTVFVECGVTGATVVDSVGMGRILARNLPVFAGFQDRFRAVQAGNKTIFSAVPDDDTVARLVKLLEEILGPLDRDGSGVLITVPIAEAYGVRLADP